MRARQIEGIDHVGKASRADRHDACARSAGGRRAGAKLKPHAALSGTVSSAKEGLMEGVVVSAKQAARPSPSASRPMKGPLQLPGGPARARPVRAQHPRRRLRPRRSQKRRRRRRTDREHRHQACADQEPGQADVQRRMVRELSRHRRREEGAAQLRELPQPRPHRALAVRRRAVRRRLQPDGRLLPGQHAGAAAAARRQRAALAAAKVPTCGWSRSISPRSI